MMGQSRTSLLALAALGILFVLLVVGRLLIEWEWWPLLLIISGLALVVALVLFLLRGVLKAAR